MTEFFLFATASRPALGPTQLPIQRVPEALSQGTERSEREDDHSPLPNAEVKNAWSYTSITHMSSWLGANLSRGTTSRFNFINASALDHWWFESRQSWEFFSSPPRPDRFWSTPSLLSNGYQGALSLGGKTARA
jgi:hypothetical protein